MDDFTLETPVRSGVIRTGSVIIEVSVNDLGTKATVKVTDISSGTVKSGTVTLS